MQELPSERVEFLDRDFRQGFIAFCRIQPEHIAWGCFTSRLEVDDIHRQQDGFIHAGILATMADHTAGYAAFTVAPQDHQILTELSALGTTILTETESTRTKEQVPHLKTTLTVPQERTRHRSRSQMVMATQTLQQ